ncbi:hypothetical protein RN607_12290 [Demequina capsici]|uniref:Uncharacterized protein n=1 Tax=Demequina capsici TaxID=3075620 RepID=A0AA96JFL5_9MICO|nr:hypothetical protein [Demequina sp. PMTSA13]WNM26969.1 hypothetical protein RN607_12290 [Demequina sp. PMTSA13]
MTSTTVFIVAAALLSAAAFLPRRWWGWAWGVTAVAGSAAILVAGGAMVSPLAVAVCAIMVSSTYAWRRRQEPQAPAAAS